ncbi:MAG: hypothetical protein ACWGQW_19005 [bacterium]
MEIREIVVPWALEDAMPRQARAERKRQSRIILGTAEIEIAEKLVWASEEHKDNPVALRLRAIELGLRRSAP